MYNVSGRPVLGKWRMHRTVKGIAKSRLELGHKVEENSYSFVRRTSGSRIISNDCILGAATLKSSANKITK